MTNPSDTELHEDSSLQSSHRLSNNYLMDSAIMVGLNVHTSGQRNSNHVIGCTFEGLRIAPLQGYNLLEYLR